MRFLFEEAMQTKAELPAAVIFDMDGVLVNSNPFHVHKWAELLNDHKIPFNEKELHRQILGQRNDHAFRLFFSAEMDEEEMHRFTSWSELLSGASHDKKFPMRRGLKSAGGCLVLLVGVSFLAPAFQCGGGSTTAAETMACCRSMGSACHKAHGNGACCKHQVSGLSSMIAAPPSAHVSGVQASLSAALLPAAACDLTTRPEHRFFSFSVAHSPPASVPLFLLHSTLLI